jgi:hypothetical protein
MITPEVAAHLDGAVMIIMSSGTSGQWPTIGRGMGVRARDPGHLDLLFSSHDFPQIARDVREGCRLAVTLSRLHDYVTYQVKGSAILTDADDADAALTEAYRARLRIAFEAMGVPTQLVHEWIGGTGLVRAVIAVSEVYHQTPGPRAGTIVGRPS